MKKHLQIIIILVIVFSNLSAQTITSFFPNTGPVGTLVTIIGTGLSSPASFTIGGINAIVVSDNDDTLVGMVMPGAVTGPVNVGTATGSGNFTVTPTTYPTVQQGNELIGTDDTLTGFQGRSVSISADGNTAIVGGENDTSCAGAVWIFTRSGATWTQDGNPLVGTGAGGVTNVGASVTLSADGNTAIVGGPGDDTLKGAVWVFTRSGSTWTQQGNKIVGTGAIPGVLGGAGQGCSVSLSADGNTAIVGGGADDGGTGAAWVFTRSGGTWTQQGSKLIGTGAVNGTSGAGQGSSVSISADGNTAIVGGPDDDDNTGAAWIFTRSDTTWAQQGNKLVGTGAVGAVRQGISVSLSADGNTAIVGAPADSNYTGGVWVYIRSGGTWTQQGSKLVGTGAINGTAGANQGQSVSLSADGNTAIVGAPQDNNYIGAVWVYTRSGGIWTQQGSKLTGTGVPDSTWLGVSVSLSADGTTAIVGGDNANSGYLGGSWVFAGNNTGINDVITTFGVTVHPNPAASEVQISISQIVAGGYDLQVYDMTGRLIETQKLVDQNTTLSISNWGSGLYLLKVNNSSGMVYTSKLVKE